MATVRKFRAVATLALVFALFYLSTSIVFQCVRKNIARAHMEDDDIILNENDQKLFDKKEPKNGRTGGASELSGSGIMTTGGAGDATTQTQTQTQQEDPKKPDEEDPKENKEFPTDDKPYDDNGDDDDDDDDDDDKHDKKPHDKKPDGKKEPDNKGRDKKDDERRKFGPEGHPMKAMSILSVVLSSTIFVFSVIPAMRAAWGCGDKPKLMRWVHVSALIFGVLTTFVFAGTLFLATAHHGEYVQGLRGIIIPHLVANAFMVIFLFSISGTARKLIIAQAGGKDECCNKDAECGAKWAVESVQLTSMVDGVPTPKSDNSQELAVALEAIRRLEAKVEMLSARLAVQPPTVPPMPFPFPPTQAPGMPPMMYMMPQGFHVAPPADK